VSLSEKIKGLLDKDKGYKARLTKGQLSKWVGRPYPTCTGDTMSADGDSCDDDFISKSEAASLCEDCCRVLESDLLKQTCKYWGECRQYHTVEHRKRDLISGTGAFYATH
jgi:hypothetical protein